MRGRLKHYVEAARRGEDVIAYFDTSALIKLVITEADLRAADAIHLATALAAMEADSVFVTWDKRLQQAAMQAGLVTAPAGS